MRDFNHKVRVRWISIFGIVLFIFCNMIYLWAYCDIAFSKPYHLEEGYEEIHVDYHIDGVYLIKNTVAIRGYAVIPGEELSMRDFENTNIKWNNKIVMRDNRTGQYKVLSTQKESRLEMQGDFNDLYHDSVRYDAAGFYASGILDGDISDYTFYLLYQSNGHNILIELGQLEVSGSL